MHSSIALLSVIAVLPAAHCIAFGGPAPTSTSPNRAVDGWTPKPTKGPSVVELRKRQTNFNPETCGWIDGDLDSAITCNVGRTCMLYTSSSIGMAGCCDGSDTQTCGWANSCIDYESYSLGGCNSNCEKNDFVRKCSDFASPYCVTWTYPSDGVADYGCAADSFSTIQTVLQSASDTFYSLTTSMTLPTLSGNAVTGIDGSSTDTDTPLPTETDALATETTGRATFNTATDSYTYPTTAPSHGGSPKPKKKISMRLIIGAVVGALFLIFIIAAAIIFFCVKKKKERQLAANQQAIATAQASRPQSQYPQQQQPQMPMQQSPMPPPTPQTQYNGYFDPQKINPQTQVHEYPISNPPTPAPPYVQPYYAGSPNAPPMPMREPTPGAHEVDAISVPQAQGQHGPVYEMGSGK